MSRGSCATQNAHVEFLELNIGRNWRGLEYQSVLSGGYLGVMEILPKSHLWWNLAPSNVFNGITICTDVTKLATSYWIMEPDFAILTPWLNSVKTVTVWEHAGCLSPSLQSDLVLQASLSGLSPLCIKLFLFPSCSLTLSLLLLVY